MGFGAEHGLDATLAAWVAGLSVATFVLGLVLAPAVFVRMPADYFVRPPGQRSGQRPALRLLVLVVKNLLGGLLLVAGIAMLVLPGQGVLTILAALTLLRFPGKRRLQLFVEALTRLKIVNIHEDVAVAEACGKTVADARGRCRHVVASIADEDLASHGVPWSALQGRYQGRQATASR